MLKIARFFTRKSPKQDPARNAQRLADYYANFEGDEMRRLKAEFHSYLTSKYGSYTNLDPSLILKECQERFDKELAQNTKLQEEIKRVSDKITSSDTSTEDMKTISEMVSSMGKKDQVRKNK